MIFFMNNMMIIMSVILFMIFKMYRKGRGDSQRFILVLPASVIRSQET